MILSLYHLCLNSMDMGEQEDVCLIGVYGNGHYSAGVERPEKRTTGTDRKFSRYCCLIRLVAGVEPVTIVHNFWPLFRWSRITS